MRYATVGPTNLDARVDWRSQAVQAACTRCLPSNVLKGSLFLEPSDLVFCLVAFQSNFDQVFDERTSFFSSSDELYLFEKL
jgi:hypothetical protein